MKHLLILVFIPLVSFSQEVTFVTVAAPDVASFKSIIRKSASEYLNDTTQAIRYPVVITSKDDISDKINTQLKSGLFAGIFKTAAKQQAIDLLDSFITIGLNKMSYKPTLNNKGILSLTVNYQSCGAVNCVDTAVIFNFDIITGKQLGIEDVISKDNLDLFMKSVKVDKDDALNKYKVDLKNQLDNNDISKQDYATATDNVTNNCMTSVQVKNFILTESSIEILDVCQFPQALDEIKPSYHLIYPYTTIKSLLATDFAEKVLQQ